MENKNNKLYEIVKPVRILEQHKSNKMKKGFIALAIVLIFFGGVGFVANSKGLDMNLPQMEFKSSQVTPNIYSWIENPPMDPNLILTMPKSSNQILYG